MLLIFQKRGNVVESKAMTSYYPGQLWLVVLVYIIFLTGFFPLKPGDSESSSPEDLPPSWSRRVGRLVIIVIDALRLDFVKDTASSGSEFRIKYLEELIQEQRATLVVTRVSPPTVTLPRLKAIMTGSVPGFVDVIRNFDTKELVEDSLIRQWRLHGRNITLFGDDTWTKLFPGQFLREDPTTSFFVSDFSEVDTNVTRHLQAELSSADWDVMILHYLGLDHIGHVEGPRSPLVQPKLDEMSSVIRTVWDSVSSQEDGVMLVLGDHGMADGGGHGGASQAETLVPLVLVLAASPASSSLTSEALQVDIAPSLAAMTGVPIPRWSLGTVLQPALSGLSEQDLLEVVKHNAEHLQRIAAASGIVCDRGQDMLDEARKMYEEKEELWRTREMFSESSKIFQEEIVKEATKYDLYLIILTIIMLFLLLVTNLVTAMSWRHISAVHVTLMVTFMASTHCLLCSFTQSELCSVSASSVVKLTFSCGLILSSVASLSSVQLRDIRAVLPLTPSSRQSTFLVVSSAGSVVSLMSSSFIEEEHQTSYFFLTTFILLATQSPMSRTRVLRMSVTLLLHRVLRNFNQTGDKWSHLPDITDWLMLNSRSHLKLLALCTSLLFILIVLVENDNLVGKLLKTVIVTTLYLQKCSSDHLTDLAQLNYGLAVLNVCCSNKPRLQVMFDTFLIVISVLQSSTNIMVVSLLLAQLHLLKPSLSKLDRPYQALAVMLVSKASYFYFGNSNSLATIDVGAAYVGLVYYNPVIVSLLLALHTFSGPLLVLLFMSRVVQVESIVRTHYFYLLSELREGSI